MDASLASLDTALQLNRQRAEAQYQRGLTLSEAGRQDEALAAFRASVRLAPSLAEAQRALASLAFRRGDLASARTALSAVLMWHPDDREARDFFARVRSQLAE